MQKQVLGRLDELPEASGSLVAEPGSEAGFADAEAKPQRCSVSFAAPQEMMLTLPVWIFLLPPNPNPSPSVPIKSGTESLQQVQASADPAALLHWPMRNRNFSPWTRPRDPGIWSRVRWCFCSQVFSPRLYHQGDVGSICLEKATDAIKTSFRFIGLT